MRFRLATRFTTTIAGILTLSIISSLVALFAAWRVDRRLAQAHQEELPSVRAEQVEILLLERNSLVAAELLDRDNPIWAKKLAQSQGQFQQWLAKVRSATPIPDDEEDLLDRLEKKWSDLDRAQQSASEFQGKGDAEKAKTILLTDIHGRLSTEVYDLCKQLIEANDRHVKSITESADSRVHLTAWVVALSVTLTLGLGGTLVWMFLYRVLRPLRGMVADARLFHGSDGMTDEDEMRTMGNYLRELMSNVADTRSRLDRSRLRLAAAEKLAAVGKLAATVAHEIRNPLTAMKMWLFAIQENVRDDAGLERKLGIISEEMTRLESIIRSFLEFSRPMELDCRPTDVTCVLQETLDLFEQRLRQHRICVTRPGVPGAPAPAALPAVPADADKLKQVFINLIGNALDAMAQDGKLHIAATVENDADGRRMVVVRFRDSGPGMPVDIRARIFDPFFTTKEDGTGLGLCIAAQIMARHEGSLVLESSTENGTTFAVWLPLARMPDRNTAPSPSARLPRHPSAAPTAGS